MVATIAFFGFFNAYALRANLSIAIVAMTENKTVVLDDNTVVYVSFDNLIVFKY
jgi:ACS family sodium-dependent inorganic phosphate cotransporter